jgi:hypothetical protein
MYILNIIKSYYAKGDVKSENSIKIDKNFKILKTFDI